jgi:hypothetical protein
MWIEDLTKALYFLNATEYKYSVCIEKIENNVVFFSNNQKINIKLLVSAYESLIYNGEVTKFW